MESDGTNLPRRAGDAPQLTFIQGQATLAAVQGTRKTEEECLQRTNTADRERLIFTTYFHNYRWNGPGMHAVSQTNCRASVDKAK